MKKKILLLSLIGAALVSPAQTYQQCVRRALDLLAVDSVEQATLQFKEALRLEPLAPSNTVVYRCLGQIYEFQGAHQKALESYGKGLQIQPADTTLRMRRAALFLLMENEERAVEDYSNVLRKHSDCLEALLFRAYAYGRQRKYPLARRDYEEILRFDPLHEHAHLGLIILNDKNRRPREAMEGINRLIEYYPKHSSLYLVRAGMETERRQYEPARHDYDKAVALAPEDSEPYMARATFFLKLGELQKAREDLKRALKLGANPDEVASLMHQAVSR